MKAFLVKSTLVAAAFVLMQGSALAGQQDFSVVNKTGYPLKHVYVSASNSDSWEEDLLGRDILEDGEEVEISFDNDTDTCKWDMKVEYTDGDTAVWKGLNLCKISKVTLKWNKKTGVTTAVTE